MAWVLVTGDGDLCATHHPQINVATLAGLVLITVELVKFANIVPINLHVVSDWGVVVKGSPD